MKPYTVLIPDLHHPEHNKEAWKAVLLFLKVNRKLIDSVVLMGDNQDCSQFSRHNKGKPGNIRKGGVQEDMDSFSREVLDEIEGRVQCDKIFHLGNHEDWLKQWLEENPEWENALSIEKMLRLKERGWKVIPQGGYHEIGKLVTIHGDSVGSGAAVAKKLVETHCSSVVMGHVHTYSAFTKCSHVKKKDKWIGTTLPTMGTTSPSYGKGKPNQHINGFGIVERYGPKGHFNLYVPIIIDGAFSFGGRVYNGGT